jgi:hypothetical protein
LHQLELLLLRERRGLRVHLRQEDRHRLLLEVLLLLLLLHILLLHYLELLLLLELRRRRQRLVVLLRAAAAMRVALLLRAATAAAPSTSTAAAAAAAAAYHQRRCGLLSAACPRLRPLAEAWRRSHIGWRGVGGRLRSLLHLLRRSWGGSGCLRRARGQMPQHRRECCCRCRCCWSCRRCRCCASPWYRNERRGGRDERLLLWWRWRRLHARRSGC